MGIDVRVKVGVGLGLLAGNGGDTLPVGTERDGVSTRSGGVGLRLATLNVNGG